MTRYKHVLVLIILILPVFALVPSLAARPTEALSTQTTVDTALPAQFVEETLRVAVYAESNVTLPAYATGGVYTDHYQNVIDLLESAGYAVTALSTQDIIDHKLMVADYDAFVLPNQLPRESIINYVKDYWLGGGGVLCFGSSVGFAFYAGLIDPSEEGNFNLYPMNPSGMWTYAGSTGDGLYDGIYLNIRNPVTKSLEEDTVYPFTGNEPLLAGFDLAPLMGARYLELAYQDGFPTYASIAGFDNPDRGGKIVFLTGNCSSFETWMEPVVVDAIDWLTPRPKGRILYDLSHLPEVTLDLWDPWIEAYPLTQWRDSMVNHSYIVDKLHPSSEGNLTTDNLEDYDMLIICMPNLNFTAQEEMDIMNWVSDGGGLLTVSDDPLGFAHMSHRLNDLLAWSDIRYNATVTGPFDTVLSQVGEHPLHESTSNIVVGGFSYPFIIGPEAYPIWEHTGVGLAIAGQEYGQGRLIVYPDGNFMTDALGIIELDTLQFHLNVANWLSAATADVLLFIDNADLASPWDAPAIDALNDLGIDFYMTFTESYMNLSLYSQQWSLVILDACWPGIHPYFDDFSSYLDAGGDLIVSWHQVDTFDTEPFYAKIGFEFAGDLPDSVPFYIWETGHGIFNYPNNYGALNFTSVDDYGDEGDLLTVFSNATALGGFTDTNLPGNATTVLGFNGQVLWNSYLIDQLTGDYDESTYADTFELWENEIAFLYYDRPTINHPSDVTYMETETGNEITWTPTADAGPWDYVFSVNGTPAQGGRWTGAPLSFNVDGVNVSITEYELTVFDRLGYSVSDLVILNVTEYIAPGPGPLDIDPMLLLIVGGAIAGVVIILVIFMKRGKKE